MMSIRIDKFGRILIPRSIRKRLGLEAGTLLRLETNDRQLVLQPLEDEPVLVEKDGLLVCTATLDRGADAFDLIDHIQTTRRDRIRALATAE